MYYIIDPRIGFGVCFDFALSKSKSKHMQNIKTNCGQFYPFGKDFKRSSTREEKRTQKKKEFFDVTNIYTIRNRANLSIYVIMVIYFTVN